MKPLGTHNYFVYILTNKFKTVLYTGVTNNIKNRLFFHQNSSKEHFATKYRCFYLIYYERFQFIEQAIFREKQIKKWNKAKKEALINELNPNWMFLNEQIG